MAEVSHRQAQALAPLFVAASVLLLALLAFNLRNLNPGAEELPPIPTREPTPVSVVRSEWGGVLRTFYLAVILTVVGIVVVGSIWLRYRGVKLSKLISVWELLGYVLATTFLVLVFLYYDTIFEALQSFFGWIGNLGGSGDPGSGAGSGLPSGSTPAVLLLWIGIAVVAVYVGFFAYRFLPRLHEAITYAEPAGKGRRELARAVRTAIRDLEAGEDFRAVVLRCYKTMVLLFEAHGIRAVPSQTAREFEADALRGMGVSQESIDDLTSLFEEARYSTHAIGESHRDGAIECLGSIRGQLEASA
jgi:hypothetical protein